MIGYGINTAARMFMPMYVRAHVRVRAFLAAGAWVVYPGIMERTSQPCPLWYRVALQSVASY